MFFEHKYRIIYTNNAEIYDGGSTKYKGFLLFIFYFKVTLFCTIFLIKYILLIRPIENEPILLK